MSGQERKAEAFAALHEGDPFVIPNPWDAGSARLLASLGFRALATTSSGFAFTLGRLDGAATLDEVVEHVAALDAATDLPVSVDLENGYGAEPEAAAQAITRVADAGAVGGSIEDYDPTGPLRATARRRADRGRGRDGARPRLPVHADRARRESHPRQSRPRGHDRTAPGVRRAPAPTFCTRPVLRPSKRSARSAARHEAGQRARAPALSLADIAGAGAQRVSVGGALTWVAAKAMADAARAMLETGDLSALAARLPLDEILRTV